MKKLLNRSFEKLRFLHTSSHRKNCDDTGPLIKKKRRFFDLKLFRQHLRRQKSEEIENEKRELLKMCAKDPPKNWDIRTFLERIEIGENIDEIEKCFKSWKEFVTITPKELFLIDCLTNEQRRKLWKYINKYNYGLYPEDSYDDFVKNFQAPPLENENKPWTQEDDKQLDYYINYYDVNFGDPWLYISWNMKRTFDQVQNKYVELYLKKQNKKRKCELCLTKCTTPLLMNRKFKLDPPYLFIVPSSQNFPTMNIFDYYHKESYSTNKKYEHNAYEKNNLKNDPLYPSYGSLIFSNKFLPFVNKSCF
ncbi:hypothetical protein PRSY57_1308800 [Plasmodium reichenowi]|uniref:Myb-like domain-containing protein n=1 Tax=Plasmodium reichenowi TaxID=5854 RepID=A0A151L6H2_PLARE|nr:hypothetical protein PRSY57_1308800 [Plasmodium reichenowi]KYN94539.1 hypothetical protein PRSY57_1308800 [Plasmodium reichenowi]